MFFPVNDSAQHSGAQRLDATHTRENYRCGHNGQEKEIQPELKRQADKVGSRSRLNLGLAFTRFGALKEMKSSAELACSLLDR